jgi:hypothetical protein
VALVVKAYAEPADKVFIISANVSHLARSEVARRGVEVRSCGPFINDMSKTGDPRFDVAMSRTIRDSEAMKPFGPADLLSCRSTHKRGKAPERLSKLWNVPVPSVGQSPWSLAF